MAVGRKDHILSTGNPVQQHRKQPAVLIGCHVTRCVRNINDRRASLDYAFDDAAEVVRIGPARIFGEVFDVLAAKGLCVPNSSGSYFEGFIACLAQLVLEMVIADSEAGVDARAFCTFEGIPCDIDVFLHSACQAADGCSVNDCRDAPDGFKVAGG